MFDRHLRPLIDPPLSRVARSLAGAGIGANAVTTLGLFCGLAAGVAVWQSLFVPALALIALSRVADGLDGAIARATSPSDFGGYYDIVADFAFYAAIPVGFIALTPAANGLAGGVLLASFYVNAASFLGFALLAERHGLQSDANGKKAWYHATGLLEGSETIAFFAALCIWPAFFPVMAYVFAALCVFTAVSRLWMAKSLLLGQG